MKKNLLRGISCPKCNSLGPFLIEQPIDTNKREVLGIIPEEYTVYTDGFSYFEEETFGRKY